MEACAYMQLPPQSFIASASMSTTIDAAAPLMVKHDYRDIRVAEGTTITIDLENFKKQLERDIYKDMLPGLSYLA